MSTFLSTYVNRVDRKGRVSVPAAYRTALASEAFQGVIVYPSLTDPALLAFGRDMFERMNRERLNHAIEGGAFEETLLGGGAGSAIETVMSLASELPFDGEGRIILPAAFGEHAGITEQATFVGRGARFEIWAPEAFERRQAEDIARLRDRISRGETR